ncbi:MAG TPA: Rid family detoxifying hydrolase [Gemmatimonadales bacterium]|nr:Rid family detoxifying hydrolase [Gemmatimonadales bacterium]
MAKDAVGIVAADGAPKAIGPYSQAVIYNELVYTAGQLALDPHTNELVGRTTAEQTDQVLKNLAAVLKAAGSGLPFVLKTTVYLLDMGDFPAMNEVYGRHFGPHKPARATLQAAALPKGARIEIEAVARLA